MDAPESDFITVMARAPMFYGMSSDRTFFTLTRQQGRAAVLILAGARAGADAARIAAGFLAMLPSFAAGQTDVYLIVNDAPKRVLGEELASGPIRAIDCGAFVAQCGLGPSDTLVLLLDRHLRVLMRSSLAPGADIARECLDRLAAAAAAERAAAPSPLTMPADPEPLSDGVPACAGLASDGSFYSLDQQIGRPAVLVLAGAGAEASLRAIMADIAPRLGEFAARDADVHVVTDGERGPDLPVRVIRCGSFLSDRGVGERGTLVLVLDRGLRVALRARPAEGKDIAGACLAALDALPREAPRAVAMPAPAIVLPNLLPPDYCRFLIDLFERGAAAEGTVAGLDTAGRPRNVVDHDRKRRRDLLIEHESAPHRSLRAILLERCRPPIARAFQVEVAHTDRILLARYDDTGGWFRRHRDNEAESVAFRQFALSLNLNTGDYEGGELLFPEYNDHRHAPPAGGGIVFASSVLHEAAPVTRGRRYVLLTFFHSEAAEARRRAAAAQPALARAPASVG